MASAFIGLGSNLGNGKQTLKQSWQELGKKEGIELCELSSPYLSEPVGMESENWFTNAVGRVETSLSPEQLLDALLAVEKSYGRKRDHLAEGYQDRTLDLDIIYFDKIICENKRLILPHPQMAERLFVLEPLVEIFPLFHCPANGVTVAALLDKLYKKMKEGALELQEITKSDWI